MLTGFANLVLLMGEINEQYSRIEILAIQLRARLLEETLGSSLTCDFLRPFPNHQQSHPANQPAEETGLSDPRRGDRRLHHPPPALRFTLNSPVR